MRIMYVPLLLCLFLGSLFAQSSGTPVRDYIYPPATAQKAGAPAAAAATLSGIDDSVPQSYDSFDHLQLQLTRYEGTNIALLLSDSWKSGLKDDERRKLIAYADLFYETGKTLMGGEPAGSGKLQIAIVPSTCGVTSGNVIGCGFVGTKGIEVVDSLGLNDAKAALATGHLPKVIIHEMTHNFDLFASHLEYGSDGPHAWTDMAEFAILGYMNSGGFDNNLSWPNKQANLYTADGLMRFAVETGFIPYIQLGNAATWDACVKKNSCSGIKDFQTMGGYMARLFTLVGYNAGPQKVRAVMQFLKSAVATRPAPSTQEGKADLLMEAFSEGTGSNFACVADALHWYVSPTLRGQMAGKYTDSSYCQDNDHDGYSIAQGDADDSKASIHPGATEVVNSIDDDGNGYDDDLALPVSSGNTKSTAVNVPLPRSVQSTFAADGRGTYLKFTVNSNSQVIGRLNTDGAPLPCLALYPQASVANGSEIAYGCTQTNSYHASTYREFTWDLAAGTYVIYTYDGTSKPGAYRLVLAQPDAPYTIPQMKPPVPEGAGFRFTLDTSNMTYDPGSSLQVKFFLTGPGSPGWVGSTAYSANASVYWAGSLAPGWYAARAQLYKNGDPDDDGSAPVWFQVTAGGGVQPCSYSFDAGGRSFASSGGSGSISVTTSAGCGWTATSAYDWISLTGATNGTGSSAVSYQVATSNGVARSGAIVVAGVSFDVEQLAAANAGPTLTAAGSLAQLASGGDWTSSIMLVNTGATQSGARLNFYGDTGDSLVLKWESPQISGLAGALIASALDRSVAPNGSIVLTSRDTSVTTTQVGSARLSTSGGIGGFGIFHIIPSGQEAVVPLETRDANSYYLAFDNTEGSGSNPTLATGVALANLSASSAIIPVTIFKDNGDLLTAGTYSLPAQGHASFMLTSQWAATRGQRGVIRFDTPYGWRISVLGIRAAGSAITTIPVIAEVVSGKGGSLAHIASGGAASGNDWATYFTLVNTGTSSATATLSFYGDAGQAPLTLPLEVLQTGSKTSASSITQSLAPNASVTVVTEGLPDTVTGSAKLTTTGSVSGFAVFRAKLHTQEAVVPLETRNPGSFVLPFENSREAGIVTAVAVANLSNQRATVNATFRGADGAVLGSSVINLEAQAHTALLLTDMNAASADRIGIAEFQTPAGGAISVLGIRAVGQAITTIPVLTK